MENLDFDSLEDSSENVYFSIMLIISVIIYIILAVSVIGMVYILFLFPLVLLAHGITIGTIKHNSVQITSNQFGDIYAKIEKYSEQLGLTKVPSAYLMQEGGALNAFATRFCSRDFMVIYSEVLDLAYEEGEDAVNFIIAHELAHIKRKHMAKKRYVIGAEIIPFLGTAYSRACERTCDNFATALAHKNALNGMLVLISGKKLYKKVNVEALIKNAQYERGFWTWMAEISSTHPTLIDRIISIRSLQARFEPVSEIQAESVFSVCN